MKILRRYLLRQHLWPFVFALSALTSFELLRQIARRLGDLLGKGLPWTVIVEFFALTVPFLIAITLSMSVLVAVLFTISRMAGDHELTAIRAGGISIGALMRPLLGAATVVACVSFLFGDQILPRTNHRLKGLMTSIARTKPTFSLKEHIINDVKRGKLALRAARIDQSTYRMRDITIYSLEQAQRKRIIYADSGYVAFSPNQEDLQLTLYDGAIHDYDSDDPRVFQQTRFMRQIVLVSDVGTEFLRREDTIRSDRELGVCELDERMRESRGEFVKNSRRAEAKEHNTLRSLVGLPPVPEDTTTVEDRPSLYCRALALAGGLFDVEPVEAMEPQPQNEAPAATRVQASAGSELQTGRVRPMRPTEVRIFRDRARSAEIRTANYAVEYHKKYAIPAACIIFVLVGVPLALRFPRGGLGLVLGAGMIVFAVYYIGLIAGESLANRLIISPFLAMWATNILMGSIGVIGLIDLRRSGAVSRRVRRRQVAEAPA